MVTYKQNIYSPVEEMPDTVILRRDIRLALKRIGKIDIKQANGALQYNATSSKEQIWTSDIQSIEDAVLIAKILMNRKQFKRSDLSNAYKRTIDFIDTANGSNDALLDAFGDELLGWLDPLVTIRKGSTSIRNPMTNRHIKRDGKKYKELFKGMKLKKVVYNKLQNYKTIDYEIDNYCVPSYLKIRLTKKEYSQISDELEIIKTPTYPELTKMLNRINYGLNVYITDEECMQTQKKKKNISIMIHDEHMYVLKACFKIKPTKPVQITQDEYNKINTELYTDCTKIKDGVKYQVKNIFNEINKAFGLRGAYSQNNIDFYNECNIRAVRYYNDDVAAVDGLDINKCYKNILYNREYVFAKQTGSETTTPYTKKDRIETHGFYYITFKNPTKIQNILFGKSCWIIGYIIKHLKLEKDIKIELKHVAGESRRMIDVETDFEYIDVVKYSGFLAKYKTYKQLFIKCSGEESKAYCDKYKADRPYYNREKEQLEISKEHLYKTSGMYGYLSILQYARYQLYLTHMEVSKKFKDVNVKKVYTDSIAYDQNVTKYDVIKKVTSYNKDGEAKHRYYPTKLNKTLNRKYGFTVKIELSSYKWDHEETPTVKPSCKIRKVEYHNKIKPLLKEHMSFCINAKAGYGKSHTLKKEIIPYLKKNYIKYIVSSTTTENANDLNSIDCKVINGLILKKGHSTEYLKQTFKNIDYIIIDECSRLNMYLINTLQYIKNNTDVSFIFIGDKNQCSIDINNEVMTTEVFNELVDYNFVSLKWHSKARYNKEYDTFLCGLLKFKHGGKDKKCLKYVKTFFKDQIKKTVPDNIINITFTNEKGRRLSNYMTVHKAQGKSIKEKHSIHEINKMNIKVLYTALSRCTSPDLITLVC